MQLKKQLGRKHIVFPLKKAHRIRNKPLVLARCGVNSRHLFHFSTHDDNQFWGLFTDYNASLPAESSRVARSQGIPGPICQVYLYLYSINMSAEVLACKFSRLSSSWYFMSLATHKYKTFLQSRQNIFFFVKFTSSDERYTVSARYTVRHHRCYNFFHIRTSVYHINCLISPNNFEFFHTFKCEYWLSI